MLQLATRTPLPTPIHMDIATNAWNEFLGVRSNRNDEPRLCFPRLARNRTVDYRDLGSLLHAQVGAKTRQQLRCEQPSPRAHYKRLHKAAKARGHTLRVVQIGANEGGSESNEWLGRMRRALGWRAALVEAVPFIYERLRDNNAVDSPRISVHNVVVQANQSAIEQGRCKFRGVRPECVARSDAPGLKLRLNATRCPEIRTIDRQLDLLQMGHSDVATRPFGHSNSEYHLRRADRIMGEMRLPCVHINQLFDAVGMAPDLLVIDTEGCASARGPA